MNVRQERHLIERVIHLLRILDENGIEPDNIREENFSKELVSLEDREGFPETCEFLRFMDEIPGGFLIYFAEGDGQIIYVNQSLLNIFQCKTRKEFRQLTGNTFRGVVHPEDWDEVNKSIKRQIFENKFDLDFVEYRIERRDGTVILVEDYGHYIKNEAVGDIFYVFIGESTDERKRQQTEQKRLLAEALGSANLAIKAKNAFLSNISHDMRTPLNAIFGFTSLAKAWIGEPEKVAGYLDRIDTASRQLLDMITKVLDISALSNAAGPAEVECDLCKTVREAYEFLMPQAKEKSLSFQLDCDSVKHNIIYADQGKLQQLVLSLANNAVTYTNSGGMVKISLTEKDELPNSYVVYNLVVEDNGIGIGEEFLGRIFEPFSREKNSTLSGVHGIGLGLTIAKSIVDMMHGNIEVKSVVNEGSTFTVGLTFRAQPLHDASREEEVFSGTSLRILVVEDNEINLEIETELLERMGFTVEPAENGKIALDKVACASPGDYDLVIMDLQMPVMDGWQASAAIRQLEDPTLAHIPIIALSADILASNKGRAMECGIDACLSKPLDFTLLLEAIEKIAKR
ncbi:response regulator [Lachnospiraceae bacterium WCA-9-b2]|jgi:PAS domain S-box-containing protein|uniref:Stage 0 sporulation protein A homolog n=1 Tax=Sporofaciens musculi TaxID=2681861 RepID=A0A7X3MIQ5_9FIRM|nr:PAS domain-containing hybrid sensor histidine kinase/response regulator [Sporofaciens musculi]MCI9421860.1 response regulator [Dorea sp.]MXP77148.1 response regulator [Sporofaciens musculi]